MDIALDRLAELAFTDGHSMLDPAFDLSPLVDAAARAAGHYAVLGGITGADWSHAARRRWGLNLPVEWSADSPRSEADERKIDEGAWRVLQWAGLGGILAVDELSLDPRTDIPSSTTRIAVPTWAGIGGVDVALQIAEGGVAVTSCSSSVAVRLPAGARGAHMSRLQETILKAERSPAASIMDAARHIATAALESQQSEAARAELFSRLKLDGSTPVTGRASPIVVDVRAFVEIEIDGSTHGELSTTFGVMTACPCTIRYSQLRAESVAGALAANLPPTFTHSQPGQLEIVLGGSPDAMPDLTLIINVIEGVAHLRRGVLKRPDEHVLVERAHRFPQFTEDLARGASTAIAAHVPGSMAIRTTASLLESIHPHSAISTVSAVAEQLWSEP